MFITLEGPEGSGKTTLAAGLRARLTATGYDVLVTREPGAGEVGSAIRQILLHGEQLDPKSELMLFLADRAQHVATMVRPHLEKGFVVICDRYADSTVVYQGYARGLDIEWLRQLNGFATGGLVPDLTILLDLPPEAGLERVAHKDRLDSEPLAFHQRVRDGFLSEAKLAHGRWLVVDATRGPDDVLAHVMGALSPRLPAVR